MVGIGIAAALRPKKPPSSRRNVSKGRVGTGDGSSCNINAIKLLLEAGANPNQNLLGLGVSSGIGLVESWLRESRPNVGGCINDSTIRILKVYIGSCSK